MNQVISDEQEDLLKKITVRLKVKIDLEEEKTLLGTGVIYYNEKSKNSVIITAKHCILGNDDEEYKISQVSEIIIQHKYLITDDFSEIRVQSSDVIVAEDNKDIAVIAVSNSDLKILLDQEKIPQIVLSHSFKYDSYQSNGYPNAFIKQKKYHILSSKYMSDQKSYFEVESLSRLSDGTGEKAINAIKGYSGSGVFIRNLNFLSGIVFELKSTSGQFDTINCMKTCDLNTLISENAFGIPDFVYQSIPDLGDDKTKEKLNIINQSLNTDISSHKESLNVTLSLGVAKSNTAIPPLGVKFTPRTNLVNKIISDLDNTPWQHFYGSIGYGKTQLTNLLARQFGKNVLWIRMKENENPISTIENIYKKHSTKDTLIVLDDLPQIRNNDDQVGFFTNLSRICVEEEIKIISTSNYPIAKRMVGYFYLNSFSQQPISPLSIEDVEDIFSLFGATKEITVKYKELVKLKSNGHPVFVNEIILFLESKGWEVSNTHLNEIFDNKFSLDFIQEILLDLDKSVPDKEAQKLLYRLSQIRGIFGIDEVKVVAKIKPQIQFPLEKLMLIKDLWIQQDSFSTYILSPLLKFLQSNGLTEELRSEINLELGKSILKKGNLDLYDASKTISYFIAANAYNDAAQILALVLNRFTEEPQMFFDSFFSIFWYYTDIPKSVDLNIRILIRINQITISTSIGKNEEALYLLNDLEKLVEDASLIGINTLHATAMLFLFYGRIDIQKSNKYLFSLLKAKNDFDSKSSLDDFIGELSSVEKYIWIPLISANDIEDVKSWMDSFSEISDEQKKTALTSKDRVVPIAKAFLNIYSKEEKENTKEEHWLHLLGRLDEIIGIAKREKIFLILAYAIRIKIWTLYLKLNKIREAIDYADLQSKEVAESSDALFIIYDALAKSLYDSNKTEKALIYYKKAIALEVELVLFEKIDTLKRVSRLIFDTDSEESLFYSKQAYEFAVTSKEIDLITKLNTIGSYAINNWYNGDKNVTIDIMEEGSELLFKANDENDSWKVALIKYGHAFNYFSHILLKGVPPAIDVDGKPYFAPTKEHFYLIPSPDLVKDYYFLERRFMYIFLMLNHYEETGDLAKSTKWAEYLIQECKINPPEYFQFARIGFTTYYILIDETFAALRNNYEAWRHFHNDSKQQLLEKTTKPFLTKSIENRPSFAEGKFSSFAGASVIVINLIKVLNDYLDNKDSIDSFLNNIKEWAESENTETEWHPYIELLSLAKKDFRDYKTILKYAHEYKGEDRKSIFIISYLLASIYAPTKEAFKFHFNLFPELEILLNSFAAGAIPFLAIPFFDKFWNKRFNERRGDFDGVTLWESRSYPQINDAPIDKKLKYLIRALSHHLSIDLSEQQENWINEI